MPQKPRHEQQCDFTLEAIDDDKFAVRLSFRLTVACPTSTPRELSLPARGGAVETRCRERLIERGRDIGGTM